VPFAVLTLYGVLQLAVGLAALGALAGTPREVRGLAVRVRPLGGQTGSWVAVDDGTRSHLRAYKVRIPSGVTQRSQVCLRVRPLTGYVLEADTRPREPVQPQRVT
jgi:hypothetical protein